jgi:hypothetical protein
MSPSDFPAGESAKQRSRRNALDYYRAYYRGYFIGPDFWKWLLTVLVSIISGGYVIWTVAAWASGSEWAARQFSPAPVASVHQAWDGKCAACHPQWTSTRADALGMQQLQRLFVKPEGAVDEQCQTCHLSNGAPHHDDKLKSDDDRRRCASCHQDHQGIAADLSRVSDSACLSCHQNPQARATTELSPIKAFGKAPAHPEFSLPASDPGQIKFNHIQHMLPWQYPSDTKFDTNFSDRPLVDTKLGEMNPDQPDKRPRLLACEDCHQSDDSTTGKNAPAKLPRDGAYMLPIRYEKHCRNCHEGELRISGEITGQIPHGLAPVEMRKVLIGLAVARERADWGLERPIPGKRPDRSPTFDPGLRQRAKSTEIKLAEQSNVAGNENQAFCAKCHYFLPATDELMAAVKPPAIPEAWLRHARFDHAAHRAISCIDCHVEAKAQGPVDGDIPRDNEKVLIPKLDKCVECHAPRTATGGGARYDCAECHRYHAGDRLPHGKGAPERGVPEERRWKAQEFILGQRAPQREAN